MKERNRLPGWDQRLYARQLRRAQKLDTAFLLEYADTIGTGTAMAFSDYRKGDTAEFPDREVKALADIGKGLTTLWAIAQVLRSRQQG